MFWLFNSHWTKRVDFIKKSSGYVQKSQMVCDWETKQVKDQCLVFVKEVSKCQILQQYVMRTQRTGNNWNKKTGRLRRDGRTEMTQGETAWTRHREIRH